MFRLASRIRFDKSRGSRRRIGAAIGGVIALAVMLSSAQAATTDYLDPSFGTAGVLSPLPSTALDVAPDGDFLVASAGGGAFRAQRYSADGVADLAFGGGDGIAEASFGGFDTSGPAVTVQPNGAILVASSINKTTCGFICAFRFDHTIVRFHADGTLDTSFGDAGASTQIVRTGHSGTGCCLFDWIAQLAIQPGGEILARTPWTGSFPGHIFRLRTDGSLDVRQFDQFGNLVDPGFGPDGSGFAEPFPTIDGHPWCRPSCVLEVASDGSLLVLRSGAPGFGPPALRRMTPDGSIDPSFAGDGVAELPLAGAAGLTTDGAGRILITGGTSPFSDSRLAVARLLAGGAIDPSFGDGGVSAIAVGETSTAGGPAKVGADGRIYAAGTTTTAGVSRMFATRLTSSGALDSTFGEGGVADWVDPGSQSSGGSVVTVQDDRPVVFGQSSHFALVRFLPSLDGGEPTVTITAPADGAEYTLSSTVTASYECTDDPLGAGATIPCAGTVASGAPIDTSSVGTKSFTVSATDDAQNTTERTVTYRVVYDVGGGLGGGGGSVDGAPTVNVGKAGRSYLATWQLSDSSGSQITSLAAVASVRYKSVSCRSFAGDPSDSLEAESTGNAGLRYDATANQYQYNWRTPGTPGCYELFINLLDGTSLSASFQLT
jgi:uncharacterized delta-60 repeat protein